MYRVRVKSKGQVTIPVRIRKRMDIGEGTLVEVREHPEGILLKPLPETKIGKVVGQKEYDKIIGELDQLRRNLKVEKKWSKVFASADKRNREISEKEVHDEVQAHRAKKK